MAHILFVTPYYPPEKGAAAVRVSQTAARLVKRGHRVTVLTTVPNYPTGIVPPEYRGRLIQKEKREGVQIIRIWSYTAPNKGFLRRVLAQLSFGCLTPLFGWREVGRPDLMIVESHPLFNAIAGRALARTKRCPFIFMVSDLWPESAVQLGVLRNPLLIKLAEWLEWSTYKRASLVWALTAGIRSRLLQRGLAPEHVFLLRNGADTIKFRPLPQAEARAQFGWDDSFIVLYTGSHGPSHRLTTVLEAAKQLRKRDDICFVLAGDGAEKKNLVAQALKEGLKNVTFLAALPHDEVPQLMAAADVCLVHARKMQVFESLLPVKMFESMACARPVLLAVDGEARKLAEEAGAAIYAEPENAEELVAGILYLHEHPEEAKILGQNGRAFIEAHFDRDQLTAELDEQIAKLLHKDKPADTKIAIAETAPISQHVLTVVPQRNIPSSPIETIDNLHIN